jgi:ArsR family transcriptional regulator, arsenate/arsenite/antimonite-responsive transcriptional repressor
MRNTNPVEFAKAIADDTRQQIMRACCCNWASVGDLTTQIGVTQPTVSHHLAILREAGLVNIRHVGKQTFYSLNQNRVVACCGQIMAVFAPEAEETATLNEALA